MALRESRRVEATSIDYIVTAAAERGGLLTSSSGAVAAYNTNIGTIPSGVVPVGVLMEDIEEQNYLTHPQRYHRNVSDIGSVVGVMTKGEVWTDFIDGYAKPHVHAGKTAYLTHSGLVTTREFAPGVVGSLPQMGESGVVVGRFLSSIDSDGFVKVRIDL